MKRKILGIDTTFLIDISKLETMFSHDDTSYVSAMQPVVKSRKRVAPCGMVPDPFVSPTKHTVFMQPPGKLI